jgi:aspartokinase-like uncharacterized kinase
MVVVKLGGSLLHHPAQLALILEQLTALTQTQSIVIVPGGGLFADTVRQAQVDYQFDDDIAHHMAILAMSQYGLLLQSFAPKFESMAFPQNELAIPKAAMWLPNDTLLSVPELEHTWSITSDSLALWLAQTLNASRLIIIKSCEIPKVNLDELMSTDVLDKGFQKLYIQQPIDTQVLNLFDTDMIQQLISS